MKLLLLLAVLSHADKGDKDQVKDRDARIAGMEKSCAKFTAVAQGEDQKIIPNLRSYWEKQDVVVSTVQGFAARCPDYQANPTIPNIQLLNADRKALQDAVKARDAVQIRKRLDAFYRSYSRATVGNTVDKFACGKAFDLVSEEIRGSEQGTADATTKGCNVPPPAPAKRK